VTRDARSKTLTVSSDGRISLTVLQMSADRMFVFAGTNTGAFRVYAWPLEEVSGYVELVIEGGGIRRGRTASAPLLTNLI